MIACVARDNLVQAGSIDTPLNRRLIEKAVRQIGIFQSCIGIHYGRIKKCNRITNQSKTRICVVRVSLSTLVDNKIAF